MLHSILGLSRRSTAAPRAILRRCSLVLCPPLTSLPSWLDHGRMRPLLLGLALALVACSSSDASSDTPATGGASNSGGSGGTAGAGGGPTGGAAGGESGGAAGAPGKVCSPGQQLACACPGSSVPGAQACKEDGSGFEACAGCPGGAGGSAGGSGGAGSPVGGTGGVGGNGGKGGAGSGAGGAFAGQGGAGAPAGGSGGAGAGGAGSAGMSGAGGSAPPLECQPGWCGDAYRLSDGAMRTCPPCSDNLLCASPDQQPDGYGIQVCQTGCTADPSTGEEKLCESENMGKGLAHPFVCADEKYPTKHGCTHLSLNAMLYCCPDNFGMLGDQRLAVGHPNPDHAPVA
jgi:hypothetical protein